MNVILVTEVAFWSKGEDFGGRGVRERRSPGRTAVVWARLAIACTSVKDAANGGSVVVISGDRIIDYRTTPKNP